MKEVAFDFAAGRIVERDVPEPEPGPDEALVRSVLVGIDGTDEAVVAGEGEPPEGRADLVLGHECLGRVAVAPDGSGLAPGDLVVPLVRHGCGDCAECPRGAPDLCKGLYVEHGIKGLDGFLREAWTDEPDSLVRAPEALGASAVLTEPLSISVKALEVAGHVQRRIPDFDGFAGKRALVAGSGSLGSLAALLLRDEGLNVHALDRSGADAAPARLLGRAGVRYADAREIDIEAFGREEGPFDLVVEATGSAEVALNLVAALEGNGVLVLLGVPSRGSAPLVPAKEVVRDLVLGNRVVIGSVNSNRGHFEEAMARLAAFRKRWGDLADRLLTHVFPPEDAAKAVRFDDRDLVKKAVAWGDAPRARA